MVFRTLSLGGEEATDRIAFSGKESTARARERLEHAAGLNLTNLFESLFDESPNPELSLVNFERWIVSTSSPRIHIEHFLEEPKLGQLLVTLMGASQPLADCLIQNPELASLILEEQERLRPVSREEIQCAGRELIKASTSHSHSLDRLRFLRQRWMLPITVNDLSGAWDQEVVWRALSDLADSLITLAVEVVWQNFSKERGLAGDCPIAVVGFGKLGGQELNYSSDIDLAYVIGDEFADLAEGPAARFCEALGRALSDRMGRGMLYRVDLRLRPYGKAGPIVNTMKAVESYYRLHAEPWEAQALVRSRIVVGPLELSERWESLRDEICFKPSLSEIALGQMLESKARTEAAANSDDLKRGKGGIRDVEFISQISQMVHGFDHEILRARATCDVLRSLIALKLLAQSQGEALIGGYRFLRKVEHRCQLEGDAQTHTIPQSESARTRLAHTMGLPGWSELDSTLTAHRRKIQDLYEEIVATGPVLLEARREGLGRLGANQALAASWLDAMPESESFFHTLAQNEGSIHRVGKIVKEAPSLVPMLKESVSTTEAIISGEIEEARETGRRLLELSTQSSLNELVATYTSERLVTIARWTLAGNFDLSEALTKLLDLLLAHCARRLYAEFSIIALGSYGRGELGIDSDADLLFLIEDAERHALAEQQAQDLLAMVSQLRRHGAAVEIDLRLRPEGKQGLLVRTFDGLRSYELDAMEMWERFALGHARLIYGEDSAAELVNKVSYAQPLTPERLRELIDMKHRIESERVQPRYLKRNVKLGHGGLSDIEWLVHIYEMRYPTATKAGSELSTVARIRSLARASLINTVECDELIEGWQYLMQLRHRLSLLGVEESVLPENPDRLEILASAQGFEEGNALLLAHERIVQTVRSIYIEGMERLKARA